MALAWREDFFKAMKISKPELSDILNMTDSWVGIAYDQIKDNVYTNAELTDGYPKKADFDAQIENFKGEKGLPYESISNWSDL